MGNTISKIQFSENAIIYKISCKDELIKDCYIGSTFNFDVRYTRHKSDCKNHNSHCYNYKLYQFIRNNGGFNNFKFEILLSFECKNSKQKTLKEQYFLDEFMPSLNSIKAYRTEEEKKAYDKEYQENNKEKIKEHYEKNKELISEYKKEYYGNNIEEILKYQKEYYVNNKAKLTEKFNCDCGGKYIFQNKARHFKSKKHQKFLDSQTL